MMFLALCAFGIPYDESVGERLGYSITLLLADVATLQLVESQMPNFPYWTILDYYMYSCFLYLVGLNGWIAYAGRMGDVSEEMDSWAMWSFIYGLGERLISFFWSL